MPTAYIKRLQQFIRQCDRLNYPDRMSPRKVQLQRRQEAAAAAQQQKMLLRASLQASLRQSVQQGGAGARYTSSADGYHLMSAMGDWGDGNKGGATGNIIGSTKPSKQRKKKGTLVIRSTHDHSAAASPTPPPPPPSHGLSKSLHSGATHRSSRRSNANGTDGVHMAPVGRAARAGGPMMSSSSGRNWISAAAQSGQQHQQQPDAARIVGSQQMHQQHQNLSVPQQPLQQQQQQMHAPNNNGSPVRYNQRTGTASANIPLSSSYHSHPLPFNAESQRYLNQHQQQGGQMQQQHQQGGQTVVHLDYHHREMRQ